jgi:hypothetical protein
MTCRMEWSRELQLWACSQCDRKAHAIGIGPRKSPRWRCGATKAVGSTWSPSRDVSIKGPGTHLQTIITKHLGQMAIPGCGCKSIIAEMNRIGPDGCREDIDRLAAKLAKVATSKEWVIEPEVGQRVPIENLGEPVPQSIRTRLARLAARTAAALPGGMLLIEWQCREMIEVACLLAEQEAS